MLSVKSSEFGRKGVNGLYFRLTTALLWNAFKIKNKKQKSL